MVSAVAPDGSGGFYIGGDFNHVGHSPRRNLAHILANGKVDPTFNPSPDNDVEALAVSGQTVYVGGYFSSIGGRPRNNIAALDAATGNATSWNPNAQVGANWRGSVDTLAVSGETIYAGGRFDSIGGQLRHGIAALDATTGEATAWNPNPDSFPVYSLAVSGQIVYAGGSFTSIGGQQRNRIAALDATTGDATSWDPNVEGGSSGAYPSTVVYALAASGQTVYAGGRFDSVGGQPHHDIAAINATTGAATSWDPNVQGNSYGGVYALAVSPSGARVYAAGRFDSIGGQPRSHLAALDAATGDATSWNPRVQDRRYELTEVDSLALSGSTLYAGGRFNAIGAQPRSGIAALDPDTGAVTSWDPNAVAGIDAGRVEALAARGQTVYAAGWFDSIGGQPRYGLAALDATTGQATSWNPTFDNPYYGGRGDVEALAVSGQTVYVGGYFSSIGGRPRNNIAALDATTGNATSWNPDATDPDGNSAPVDVVTVSGSTVYACGWFTWIGGRPRNGLAALDAATGDATSWDPDPKRTTYYTPGAIDALTVSGQTVYVGGSFSSIGGQLRRDVAALDVTTGNATSWNPSTQDGARWNRVVEALAVSGETVYVGGNFRSIGGQSRKNVAALDVTTGRATGWGPTANGVVLELAVGPDGSLWAGGNFTGFPGTAGASQSGIAKFAPKQ